MRRREFIGLIGTMSFWPDRARGQHRSKVRLIGLATTTPSTRDAFIDELRILGRDDVQVEVLISPSVEDLVRLIDRGAECLAVGGPLSIRQALEATRSVPIVAIDLESDPVASGFAASLARPGGALTGIFLDLPELAGKQLELIKQAVPGIQHLAVLYDNRIGEPQLRVTNQAAQMLGVTTFPLSIHSREQIEPALERIVKEHLEAVLVLTAPVVFQNRALIAEGTRSRGLPSASIFPSYAEEGGLIGYGPNQAALFRQAAKYVDRILRGTSPAELPIERPSKFQLIINLQTAKALGLTVPQALLARADEVIE